MTSVTGPPPRLPRSLVPLLLCCAVVVLGCAGLSRGLWLGNLHNLLLAVALTAVGAHVLDQRPGHREGRLFLAAGLVEALLFLGRQVGHAPDGVPGARWWTWLGVWPVVVALALVTAAVVCFPDGRLPSTRWRPVAGVVLAVTVGCATLSAVWPVEYAATGVAVPHPLNAAAPPAVAAAWGAVAHPAYVGFQLLWVVAVVARWRSATGTVRDQLAWLLLAAGVSAVALVVGLVVAGTPRAGLLSAALLPLAAGWAIVHGRQVAAYSALSWLSRARSADLPGDHARAVAEALDAPTATLWLGDAARLLAVGVWPDSDAVVGPTTVETLRACRTVHLREVVRDGRVVGAVTAARTTGALSRGEGRLLDDLAAQAALVLDHLTLAEVVGRQRVAGTLDTLTPRERDVLDLMARGLTNTAICAELHLSVKTVEPVVSAIFVKLGLRADTRSNRRVLAVLAYLRT